MEGLLVDWKKQLQNQIIAELGQLQISTKNIALLVGISLSGKTATCVHLMNDAIRKGHTVLYFDTEKSGILDHQEPNLVRHFIQANQKGYDEKFMYQHSQDTEKLFAILNEKKPDLVIIDSVYEPFTKFEVAFQRTTKIIEFLKQVREWLLANDKACIITSQVSRVIKDGKEEQKIRGGESLKYITDLKVLIQMPDQAQELSSVEGKRFFVIDKQDRYVYIIKRGGFIEQAKVGCKGG